MLVACGCVLADSGRNVRAWVSAARRPRAACARCPRLRECGARRLPARCPHRASYEPNAPSRPGAQAARRSRRARRTPVHGQGASPALPVLLAAAVRVSPARCRAVAARAAAARKRHWHGTVALCHAQASLPTKAPPPVKRRFGSSLARRLLPLSAARAYAPNVQSGPSACGRAVTPCPPDLCCTCEAGLAGAARSLRTRSRGPARAVRRSHFVRQTLVHVPGTSLAPLVLAAASPRARQCCMGKLRLLRAQADEGKVSA